MVCAGIVEELDRIRYPVSNYSSRRTTAKLAKEANAWLLLDRRRPQANRLAGRRREI
jgi:hypothetical protein